MIDHDFLEVEQRLALLAADESKKDSFLYIRLRHVPDSEDDLNFSYIADVGPGDLSNMLAMLLDPDITAPELIAEVAEFFAVDETPNSPLDLNNN